MIGSPAAELGIGFAASGSQRGRMASPALGRGLVDFEGQLASLVDDLRMIQLGSDSVRPSLAHRFQHLVSGVTMQAKPVLRECGVEVEDVFLAGDSSDVSRVAECLTKVSTPTPERFSTFNPISPEPFQRNVVVGDMEMRALGCEDSHIWHVYREFGVDCFSQMRALICDGPRLLTWFGAFRAEPFGKRERHILSVLVEPVRIRLRAEQILGVGPRSGVELDVAIEEISAPAFIASRSEIELANSAGTTLLTRDYHRCWQRIRQLEESGGKLGQGTVLRLSERAAPIRALVIFHETLPNAVEARERWKLTPRQSVVLECLVRGESNKEIAAKLGCSLRGVEAHVTAILRRTDTESRTQLVSRVLGGA